MDYKTRRYKQGLEGKKPSSFWLDEKGHRAQAAGYRDHLRNQDLADKILRSESDTSSSYDYDSPSEPLKPWQRVLWFGIGAVLLYWDYLLSDSIATYASTHGFGWYWLAFAFYFAVLPGGILGWPAYVLILGSLSKD